MYCMCACNGVRKIVARFLGYDMHSGNPMMGAMWVVHVQALRDAAVDKFIERNKPKDIVCSRELCSRLASIGRPPEF